MKQAITKKHILNRKANNWQAKVGIGLEKLTLRHTEINIRRRKEIDHYESSHTSELQRSKYLSLDSDILNQKKFNENMNTNLLNVKYCIPKKVKESRHKYLIFKSAFAQK